ncbi:MAG: HAD family hydrolase [Hungatella sp.]|nr:HAD family hydrolase [Hungatella sp.]
MIKVLFCDLFFTLIVPHNQSPMECEVLNLSLSEWEHYSEETALYKERAVGHVNTEQEIIEGIVETLPFSVTKEQEELLLDRREKRMRRALSNVDQEILKTLKAIRNLGIKTCLISNADIIDCKYWKDSPLYDLFDLSIFSCNVKLLKPDIRIYQYAMDQMGTSPKMSVFAGDGGSDELEGAKMAGMKTVFSEYLDEKPEVERIKILEYADYHINKFSGLIDCLKAEWG